MSASATDIVYIETYDDGFCLDKPEKVCRYAELQRRLQAIALDSVESRNLLVELAGWPVRCETSLRRASPTSTAPFQDGSWFTSSYTNEGANDCVEVNHSLPGHVGVRDSKLGAASPVLAVTFARWACFLAATRDGTLDVRA